MRLIPLATATVILLSLGCANTGGRNRQPLPRAAVSSADPIATEIGLAVLRKGGNAADASVAIGFALAVCYPSAGNLGGGGFAVCYRPDDELGLALDFRETAPAAATRDMYLDEAGEVVPDRSRYGHLAVGVPGSVAGMWALHERLGSMPWKLLLAPAIRLADEGFVVSPAFAADLARDKDKLARNSATARQYLKEGGGSYRAGETLRLPELAQTLRRIAEQGPDGFYKGATADAIVTEMERGGGLITHDDLAGYEAKWRDVVSVNYRGHTVWSMPPPSSGGICLGLMLQMLAGWPRDGVDLDTLRGVHRYVECARRAYADRAAHLGDDDFYDVPRTMLLSRHYAEQRRAGIVPGANASATVRAGEVPNRESEETTHYSVLDGEGNAVSVTTTLNFGYGSLVTVPGAGFLLNNEMDDFSAKPGVPNAYGLVGAEANAIEPGKRMLSSMSPTIVTRNGKVVLVVGTPGGSTIITSVLQVILRVLDQQESLSDAVGAPRIHHQWLPDVVFYEENPQPLPRLISDLEEQGYTLKPRGAIGDVCAIHVGEFRMDAVADPRRRGSAGTIALPQAAR